MGVPVFPGLSRDTRLESGMRTKADVRRPLQI